jgi:tripartite-type tricarboxylate transporter receptor subunit TctC
MSRVAKAAPDGYTIAVWHIAQATAPALYEGLKYDVVSDFDHLGRITDVPMTLVSKTAVPAKNVTELLDWIRSEGGKVTYGHAGVGSASHLCALIFMKEIRAQMQGVAYRGTGQAMNDLISDQFVSISFSNEYGHSWWQWLQANSGLTGASSSQPTPQRPS